MNGARLNRLRYFIPFTFHGSLAKHHVSGRTGESGDDRDSGRGRATPRPPAIRLDREITRFAAVPPQILKWKLGPSRVGLIVCLDGVFVIRLCGITRRCIVNLAEKVRVSTNSVQWVCNCSDSYVGQTRTCLYQLITPKWRHNLTTYLLRHTP